MGFHQTIRDTWAPGLASLLLALVLALTVPSASAAVTIAPWFPQETNYVFQCSADTFSATHFDWNFGDGQSQTDTTNADVYHSYGANGTYEVACTASDDSAHVQTSLLRIQVGAPQDITANTSVALTIAPYYPQGPDGSNYVFSCDASGFTPSSYDWDFGDGQLLHDVANSNVYHTYSPGNYAVECTATNGSVSEMGEIHINVGGTSETPTNVLNATVAVDPSYPQGSNYVFTCNTAAFSAASYTWFFGDGQSLHDMTTNNVYHTYGTDGSQTVECDAKDASGSQLAKGFLTVNVNGSSNSTTNSTTNSSTNSTGNTTAMASLLIAPWFPMGHDYVFVCNASGFTATNYDWNFGDGQSLTAMTQSDVYHTFGANGTYNVSCNAYNSTFMTSDSLVVNVS